jgi:hypothetical protein
VVAWVGYQIYLSLAKIQAQARRQMGDNVVFTKDGMRVHVKDMADESYVDKTQSWVVKAWNLGSATNAQEEAAKRKRYVLKVSPLAAMHTTDRLCVGMCSQNHVQGRITTTR